MQTGGLGNQGWDDRLLERTGRRDDVLRAIAEDQLEGAEQEVRRRPDDVHEDRRGQVEEARIVVRDPEILARVERELRDRTA